VVACHHLVEVMFIPSMLLMTSELTLNNFHSQPTRSRVELTRFNLTMSMVGWYQGGIVDAASASIDVDPTRGIFRPGAVHSVLWVVRKTSNNITGTY